VVIELRRTLLLPLDDLCGGFGTTGDGIQWISIASDGEWHFSACSSAFLQAGWGRDETVGLNALAMNSRKKDVDGLV
jgi:hypothetical protein